MSLQVRPLDPNRDDVITKVLDAAFARSNRESRMAHALGTHPDFDPELSLVAFDAGEPIGAALFMPRHLRIHRTSIRSAACAPIGVVPNARGRGAGRALLEAGLERLRERNIRCVTAIGAPEFFGAVGFGSAFNLYAQRVPISIVREHADLTADWRGLQGADLGRLGELDALTWTAIDGSELRGSSALDWEANAIDSHALCTEERGQLSAYLRFRIRETVEVTDCCVRGPAGIADVFALLARLGDEHARELIELRLPPGHPVVKAAFRLGCPVDSSDFGGAAVLAVLDWPKLLEELAAVMAPQLLRAARPSLSLGIEGVDYRLYFRAGRFECTRGRDPLRHVALPSGWAPGLLTGKYDGSELAFEVGQSDAETVALLEALFPRRSPTWTYGPIYESADD